MTRVLVAVDETEASVAAAAAAHRLFGDDAEYFAINVFERAPVPPQGIGSGAEGVGAYPSAWGTVWPYEPPFPGRLEGDAATNAYEMAEDAAVREARDVADRAGLPDAAALGDVGDAAEAILAAADAHDVDVVVVGSHERRWFGRLFSPSVSAAVVKRASVPVLVAK